MKHTSYWTQKREIEYTPEKFPSLIVREICTLHESAREAGCVTAIRHKSQSPEQYLLQAEAYYGDLPNDSFFARGLITRGNVAKPLDQAAMGVVLSKMEREGIILEGIANHLQLYLQDLPPILNAVEFQKIYREEFADFLPLAKNVDSPCDHAYQPPGPDVEQRMVLYRDLDLITKEKILSPYEGNVIYGYWNNQKVFRTERLEGNLEISVGRDALRLRRSDEGIHLRNNKINNNNQIEALKAAIQFTWNYFQHRDPDVWKD